MTLKDELNTEKTTSTTKYNMLKAKSPDSVLLDIELKHQKILDFLLAKEI
jgi:chemotaxis response regulator CheB